MVLGIDQIEFFSPTFTSLLVFGLTFVVGYLSWTFAFYRVGQLSEWLIEVQAFDKTILTFAVGGAITFIIALIESTILYGWDPNLVLIPDFVINNFFWILIGDLVAAPLVGWLILVRFLNKANHHASRQRRRKRSASPLTKSLNPP